MRYYKVTFKAAYDNDTDSIAHFHVTASSEYEARVAAITLLRKHFPATADYFYLSEIISLPPLISTLEDFELDRVYIITKDSEDGTCEVGDHVWRDSNNPERLNHQLYGLLYPEAIDDRTVFSAEFEVDPTYVCITILGEDSRIMSKSFYDSNVIIK